MSLFAILDLGRSGTQVSRSGVQTAGNNIANTTTEGFSRRDAAIVSREAYTQGGLVVGNGARVDAIVRTANEVLSHRVRNASSQSSAAEARHDVLTRADALLGELGEATLATSLDGFLNSFDALSAMPHDDVTRAEVIEAASLFVADINAYGSEVARMRAEIDDAVRHRVDEVNGILADLEQLTKTLVLGSADDLDRRDLLLGKLGEIVDVHVLIDEQNVPQVYLRHEGSSLFNGVARPLSTSTAAGGEVRIEVSTAAGKRDVTDLLAGGRLAGLVEARDRDLVPLANRLDQLAFDIAGTVNAIHAAGYGLDGVTGRNLFSIPGTAAGAAMTIAVDPSVAGNPAAVAAALNPALLPGDNTNALALAQVRNTVLSSGEVASDALAIALHDFGSRVHNAGRAVTATTQTHERLALLEEELRGVSIDEEMTKLMEYQRSYAAAAKVIQTADELFDVLLSLKR
jgi:flagellar hook-associated protein 1 FlgK